MKMVMTFLVVCGCASPSKDTTQAQTQGIARVVRGQNTKLVITSETNRDRINEAVANKRTDFHWVSFSLPENRSSDLESSDGVEVDLVATGGLVTFSQMYRETCNPALENLEPCWIYEGYSSGERGLSGRATLRITDNQLYATYEVNWEGITTRFGSPDQQYSHSTIGAAAAVVIEDDK